jgi:hypothetical protein
MITFVLYITLQSAPNVFHEALVPSENMTKAQCIELGKGLERYDGSIVWECRPNNMN